MTGGELNFAWARAIVEVLVGYGIEEVEVAPGSRSAPLVLAALAESRLRVRVHLDERSAGFFAVGYARAHLGPAAVVTTSGTAVANLLPAVVEADHSDVPMIVVSADRPPEVRGADANQTIVQTGIFGGSVRGEVDLPLPSRERLRQVGRQSVAGLVEAVVRRAFGPPGGPVHLNVPFAKPLQPPSPVGLGLLGPEDPRRRRGSLQMRAAAHREAERSGRRWRNPDRGAGRGLGDPGALVAELLEGSRRPLLVAGPATDPGLVGPATLRFAERLGIPTLADPLSGARFDRRLHSAEDSRGEGGPPTILGGYDHYLRSPPVTALLTPDLIVRVGRTPTSGALEEALAVWGDCTQVVVDDGSHPKDHQRLADHYLRAPAAELLEWVAERTPPRRASAGSHPGDRWREGWRCAETAAWEAIAEDLADTDHEGAFAAAVVRAMVPGSTLFVSSSMPVRDVDAYAQPAARGIQVLGNRGASGIDGVVSSAMGCAGGGAGPVVGIIGDVALYHDMNGLLAARDRHLNVVIALMDNDGGGIFHLLPIRDFEPAFTPCFAAPHGLDFRHSAELYGLRYTEVASPAELEEAVAVGVRRAGTEIVRVPTDRERNRRGHLRTRRRVARRVLEVLDKRGS